MVSLSLYIDGIICFLMIFYYLFNMELHAADVQNRQWANYCWELLELSDLMAFCSRAPRSSSGWWNRPELRHRRVSLFKKKNHLNYYLHYFSFTLENLLQKTGRHWQPIAYTRVFRKEPNVADTSRGCIRTNCWGCYFFREEPPRTGRGADGYRWLTGNINRHWERKVPSSSCSWAEDLPDTPRF